MNLDINKIDYLAKLIKIHLNNEEKEKYLKDLEEIINYLDNLDKLSDDIVIDYAQKNSSLGEEDEIEKFFNIESLKKAFPRVNNEYLEVPAIFKENKNFKDKKD